MNLTPNSFSDGNQLNSFDEISTRLQKFKQQNVDVVDIGFESTAPMNKSLSLDEEMNRLETFLTMDLSTLSTFRSLSIDSYRPQVIETVLASKLMNSFKGRLIWNDISGQFDDEALKLLNKYPTLDYVFCHNLSPDRESGSSHMEHASENPDLLSFFGKAVWHFKSIAIERVFFDPCFGFSKTADQNIKILKSLPKIMSSFESSRAWVIGLSRKSFMRSFIEELDSNLTREDLLSYSEYFHVLALSYLKNIANPLYFRVHNPLVVSVSDKFLHLF